MSLNAQIDPPGGFPSHSITENKMEVFTLRICRLYHCPQLAYHKISNTKMKNQEKNEKKHTSRMAFAIKK